MVRQIAFTRYEAVLLLDAFLQTQSDNVPRLRIVKKCSQELRRMAVNSGLEIDEIYRNVNGISFQMASMESAYKGETIVKPATRLFNETVNLYRNNRNEYERILKKAKVMVSGKQNNQELFMAWLSYKVPPAQLSELYQDFQEIEQQALKTKVVRKSLYESFEISAVKKIRNSVEHSKFLKLKHKGQMRRILAAMNYLLQFAQEQAVDEKENTLLTVVAQYSELEKVDLETPEDVSKPVVQDTDVQKVDDVSIQKERNEYKVIDFKKINSFAYTKPITLVYFGVEKTGLRSWKQLYLLFFSMLYKDYPQFLSVGMNISKRKTNRIDLGDSSMKASMVAPKPIPGTTLFLETNISATDIVLKIRFLLDFCKINYENILICYVELSPYLTSNRQPGSSTIENIIVQEDNFADISTYEDVLIEYFSRGFRLDSILELRKFRKYYETLNGVALDLEDDKLQHIIQKCGIEYAGRIYMPQTMLSQDMEGKLFEHIARCFEAGKEVIYFEVLFKEFSEEFLDYYIYNVDMLRLYLLYMNKGRYHIDRNYLSKNIQITPDPKREIQACLKANVLPMTVEEICQTLSYFPADIIRDILGMNGEFVRNSKGEYFHVDSLELSNEELENIVTLISDEINRQDFISGNELYAAIQAKYPYTYEKNAGFSMIGWRDALKYKIGDKFSFVGNIISGVGVGLSMSDVFADYGRTRQAFSMNELLQFANEMGSTIYFDSLYQHSMRISQEYFVQKDGTQFRINETDTIIERFCKGYYISITEITEFGTFPDAGYPWTNYLLESYVASFSEKYYLLHGGYNRNCAVGAIVEKQHAFKSFDDLLVDVLAYSDIPLEKAAALNYLANKGYIARRSYTNIGSLLIYAREQRNRKGM